MILENSECIAHLNQFYGPVVLDVYPLVDFPFLVFNCDLFREVLLHLSNNFCMAHIGWLSQDDQAKVM